MKEKLEAIKQAAVDAVKKAVSEKDIEDLRVLYLGKKGELTAILKQMGGLSPEERPKMGQLVNDAKSYVEELVTKKKEELKTKAFKIIMIGLYFGTVKNIKSH